MRGSFFASLIISLLLIMIVAHSYAASTPQTGESVALQFLGQVAGLGSTTYQISSINDSGPFKLPNSSIIQHFEDDLSAVVNNTSAKFNAFLVFTDGNLSFYQLNSPSGNFGSGQQNFNDSLQTLIDTANRYYAFSNESSWNSFGQLASTALQTQSLTIGNGDFSLQIQNGSDAGPGRALWATCYDKIDGEYISPYRSMQIGISNNGLVTNVVDGMMKYHIADSNVTVSKDQAIAIAQPSFNAFAQQNQLQIVGTNTTFTYGLDGNGQRGDTLALHPQWDIEAYYNGSGEYNASSYSVTVWADNGEIAVSGPDGFFGNTSGSNITSSLPLLLVLPFIAIFGTLVGLYLRRKPKIRR